MSACTNLPTNPLKQLPGHFSQTGPDQPTLIITIIKNGDVKIHSVRFSVGGVLHQVEKAEPPNHSFSKKQKQSTRKGT